MKERKEIQQNHESAKDEDIQEKPLDQSNSDQHALETSLNRR
jgi:hypothetical protein